MSRGAVKRTAAAAASADAANAAVHGVISHIGIIVTVIREIAISYCHMAVGIV